jgi:hypothetical protein
VAGQELETRSNVSPADEPSAEWGWHGSFPNLVQVMGWAIVAVLLLMLIGNHTGRVEDVYLVGLAAITAGLLVFDLRRRRTSWRR